MGKFLLTRKLKGERLELAAGGSWTAAHASELETFVEGVAGEALKAKNVSIDMAGVREFDSFGAWLLERLTREWTASGRKAVIVGLPEHDRGLLEEMHGVHREPPTAPARENRIVSGLAAIGLAGAGLAAVDTFSDVLARNSDKVDGILAGLERMTGGGASKTDIPLYDLVAASTFPPPPEEAPSWLLVVPEPTTLMGFNTDKILVQPAAGESTELPNARWNDNLPVLFQEKVIQSFENAGYARSVSRTREGITGNYQLLIDIRRFHVSTSDSTADIGFMAKILDQDGKIIHARLFQATAPTKRTDAQAYVTALDEAFGKLLSELLVWTTAALGGEPLPRRS